MKKIRIAFVIVFALFTAGCSYDNLVYKYGNGIKDGIKGGAMAMACVAVSPPICIGVSALEGYIDGKQQARDKIIANENAALVKAIADKKAKDMGVVVEIDCWFWNPFCRD